MKLTVLLLCLLPALIACMISNEARYDNYRMYNIKIGSRQQLDILRELRDTSDSVMMIEIQQNGNQN